MSNITFYKTTSIEPASRYLAEIISSQLAAGKKVLWLVPGGSSMAVAVEAAKRLKGAHLRNLTVTLTDERYGSVGHADSNWQQLKDAGFVLPGATMRPVLIGKDFEQTAKEYNQTLEEDLKKADYSLALAGMGPDGHIFGIKPGSPSVESDNFAVGYEWEDYSRITATVRSLKKLNEVVVFAVGREKRLQLDALQTEQDPNVQPAQLLKQLKKVIIFNDHKGEPV